ncbi:TIGR04283 family arsenosugar biosynthesis glycosyltransferase [Croceivirga thetidis]|uniref:Glycosyltransferase family 2 protein n=1 Tax=Croceivirga thetidis TaxID=2721623 RepID=A0ABX1GS03_9FLAO|nr:TIGR04283 family arsenosugar biosynthesis glycosyltransferase [Croceivirga thetidis]NKI32723.1 glycosyltransferase family 2 protein [Croceivirga thetidis]
MISVIIPAYNEAQNLKNLLPLLEQISENHEVEIIVSCGDCNVDYEGSFKHLKKVKFVSNKRRGRAVQMNDGVSIAQGKILVFLHADVIPPKDFFAEIRNALCNKNQAGFFSYRFDKTDFILKVNALFTRRKGLFTGGGDQCLFIKKAVFERLGGFDENQVLMEDFEFFRRMKKANIPYCIIKNDLVVSARKYERNSYLKINLSNLLLVLLFKLGLEPKKLKYLHDRLLNTNYS